MNADEAGPGIDIRDPNRFAEAKSPVSFWEKPLGFF
jgi:hypothetical protein